MTDVLIPPSRRDPILSRESLLGSAPPSSAPPKRLLSLDAYRGLIMILLASSAFGLHRLSEYPKFRDDPTWQTIAFQTDHVEWQGGTLLDLFRPTATSAENNRLWNWFGGGAWDLIQPSFMFMVGVAMPFSYAARRARGEGFFGQFGHAFTRALALILLGVFLRSTHSTFTNWTFMDVVSQIGLGYVFVFLIMRGGVALEVLAIAAILGGYWAWFAYSPLPPADYDYKAVGMPDGPIMTGFFQHWDKNANPAHYFDVWFLNLFPRLQPFAYDGGGYNTLNFVPSMATMLFGVLAGQLIRTRLASGWKFLILIVISAACLAGGAFANESICPIVKRIWTPSWAVYSAGWTFLILALFYLIVDGIGLRWLGWPLAIVGMNSIAVYCMQWLLKSWVSHQIEIHAGADWYHFAGDYGVVAQAAGITAVFWLVCLYCYKRGIFIRL